MQKLLFRMVMLGGAVFAMSQPINIEAAHAGSVVDQEIKFIARYGLTAPKNALN